VLFSQIRLNYVGEFSANQKAYIMVLHTTSIVAEVLLHEKVVTEEGDVVEVRILRVPKDNAHPEGLRYALVYIHQNKRVIGYDNFERKGHHKHQEKEETPYRFENVEKLLQDFWEDVKQWKSKKLKSG
jgi:hypothetical protein